MAIRDRSIGGQGALEQGGPNLGNDYSRDISRERADKTTSKIVVPNKEKENQAKKKTTKPGTKK
ncbi:hypothetical protein MKQ68_09525 [Chitinophaga horti]|uniref:Uncharacterized protein n=1 Tax=Chitinophaga horti TaxID=2920382 RepID=A0ABY6JAN2_9BACT|nr:hypothetical protein [Chitinophaga horti]UYQ95336.1 hypothetical protein MKQ68_09525 [Chitinophaga horti]